MKLPSSRSVPPLRARIVPALLQPVPLTAIVPPATSAWIVPWLTTATLLGPPQTGAVADGPALPPHHHPRPDRQRRPRRGHLEQVVRPGAGEGDRAGPAQRLRAAELEPAVVRAAADVDRAPGERQAAGDRDVSVAGGRQVEGAGQRHARQRPARRSCRRAGAAAGGDGAPLDRPAPQVVAARSSRRASAWRRCCPAPRPGRPPRRCSPPCQGRRREAAVEPQRPAVEGAHRPGVAPAGAVDGDRAAGDVGLDRPLVDHRDVARPAPAGL